MKKAISKHQNMIDKNETAKFKLSVKNVCRMVPH